MTEPYSCGVVIPEPARRFLQAYPNPYLVPAESIGELLTRYRDEVEPHYRWHYCGPVSREPACFLGYEVKTGSHADNMPGDWKWRSYLVKEKAGHKCENPDCDHSSNLEADHILRISIWRSDEIADIDYSDYEAPHSLNNLQCLCFTCHKIKTLEER